ncbi:MAG: D-alanyl-D-alanine carboxypeptidase/D-alanyl-D-alanine-endopeptidase [Elainellaceae cyanobacterium]
MSQIFAFSIGLLTFWAASSQLLPAAAQVNGTQTSRICPSQLDEAIAAVTEQPNLQRSHWGILVQTLGDQQTLYAQDADRYFIPASNAKLLTTAAALEELGPQFRIRTSVYQLSSQTGGTVLRVIGRGDPSFTEAQLANLIQQIRDRGISQIDLLIGDDSYFQGDAVNSTWEWEDIQAGYGAPANSLMLNQNAVGLTLVPQAIGQPLQVVWDDPNQAERWQISNRSRTVDTNAPEFLNVGRDFSESILSVRGQLRVGSASEPVAVSIPQPAQHFMQQFLQLLLSQGIQVNQTLITHSPSPEQGVEIAAIDSPALPELLVETNQESNNLYAEALLRSLGKTQPLETDTTLESGLLVLNTTLTRLRINPDSYDLVDGSGLSRQNLISPEAIVQTLQAMNQSAYASTYQQSLAIAGISGTLRNRFQNTGVQGKLRGKTGALSNVTALSGYLAPPDYPELAFSIIVNQTNQPLNQVQGAIDQIVEQLIQLQPCFAKQPTNEG